MSAVGALDDRSVNSKKVNRSSHNHLKILHSCHCQQAAPDRTVPIITTLSLLIYSTLLQHEMEQKHSASNSRVDCSRSEGRGCVGGVVRAGLGQL